MERFFLTGKIILITGGSSGIGAAAALASAEAGAVVYLNARNAERAEKVLKTLPGEGHQLLLGDLTDEDQRNHIVDELPKLHGVVHSAGLTAHMPARFIRKKNLDQLFHVNYEAVVLLTARILAKKKIEKGGSFVFLSSIATKYPYFGGAIYSGTKAAIEAYSKTLATELAPKRIRSNCLKPSFVKGPMVEEAGKTISDDVLKNFEKMMPLGFGEPEDVANAVVFFLSDASKWITGTELILGGG
ncbi:MAG TPA: SDR family oxidoreductase [Bacteroidales bacterium]|nr:SDR family oxidoreductase [Bacteroidales bacterium]